MESKSFCLKRSSLFVKDEASSFSWLVLASITGFCDSITASVICTLSFVDFPFVALVDPFLTILFRPIKLQLGLKMMLLVQDATTQSNYSPMPAPNPRIKGIPYDTNFDFSLPKFCNETGVIWEELFDE